MKGKIFVLLQIETQPFWFLRRPKLFTIWRPTFLMTSKLTHLSSHIWPTGARTREFFLANNSRKAHFTRRMYKLLMDVIQKTKTSVVREDKRCPRGGYAVGSSLCTGFFPRDSRWRLDLDVKQSVSANRRASHDAHSKYLGNLIKRVRPMKFTIHNLTQ